MGALDRAGSLCGRFQRVLEPGYVRGDGGGIEADAESVGPDDGSLRHSRRLELVAKAGKGNREAVPKGGCITLGPEKLDQEFAGMDSLYIVSQISEEGGDLLSLKAGDYVFSPLRPQTAQETNSPGLTHI